MPVGNVIGEALVEFVLRPIFEFLFVPFLYWSGRFVVSILTFGRVKSADLNTSKYWPEHGRSKYGRKPRRKKKPKLRCSAIWLKDADGNNRRLSVESCFVIGFLAWIAFGVGMYFLTR